MIMSSGRRPQYNLLRRGYSAPVAGDFDDASLDPSAFDPFFNFPDVKWSDSVGRYIAEGARHRQMVVLRAAALTQFPSKNWRGFSTVICWMTSSETPNSFSRGSTFRGMKL